MRVLEYKLVASRQQGKRIDEAIRVCQFIRNKCLRLWMDTNANKNKLYTLCAVLAKEYPFAHALKLSGSASGFGTGCVWYLTLLEA